MRVIAGEQAGTRGSAGRCRYMTACKGNALAYEAVQIWRVDVFVTEGANRVETLLICDNEDNIGTGHCRIPLNCCE